MIPDSNSLLEDLDLAVEFVEGIGDEIIEERAVKIEPDDGAIAEGHGCEHGTHNYIVWASEPWNYLAIAAGFNLDQTIAVQNRLQQFGSQIPEEGFELREEEVQTARENLDDSLEDANQEVVRSVRLTLIKSLAVYDIIVDLERSDTGIVHGFEVKNRVYHTAENFHIGDFHTKVQQLISVAWYGREYLAEAYGLSNIIGSEEESTGPPDTPGFQ